MTTDVTTLWPVFGWEIEALPKSIVRCMLRFANSIEEAEKEEYRFVVLGLNAEQCEALAQTLLEKAAQSRIRERPSMN